MESADGESGYRLEFDDNHGAHINVYCRGKSNKYTYTFPGDCGVVNALYKQLFQWETTRKIYKKQTKNSQKTCLWLAKTL